MNLGILNKDKKIPALLMTIGKNMGLYPDGHPEIVSLVDQLYEDISSLLSGRERLTYSFRNGQIFFEEEILIEESFSCIELTSWCEAKNIDRVIFLPQVDREEIIRFISLLRVKQSADNFDFSAEFKLAGFSHIEVKKLVAVSGKGSDKLGEDERHSDIKKYELATVVISDIFDKTRKAEMFDQSKVDGIVDWLVKGVLSKGSSFGALTSLKNFDDYTCRHSINVAILSLNLGLKLGLREEQLVWLATGALLHDIGKMHVPIKILNKANKLTRKEWEIIKAHPVETLRILSGWPSIEKSALVIGYEHHMGCDLSGYPESPGGTRQHVFSRLVQVADVYDGLTSERAYHTPFSPAEAQNYMLNEVEKGLDQTLVKLLIE